MAAAFGVSIGTLRHAVDELVAEHILIRRQGRGTYVATHNADRSCSSSSTSNAVTAGAMCRASSCLAFERVRLDDDAALALTARPGDAAIQIDNRLSLQGRAVVHDRLTLPAVLFKGLTEKRVRDRTSTIYHLYQTEFGITVLRTQERLRAVAADRTAARVLGVAPGTPMLQVRRTALTFNDKPVEYRVSTIHSAYHEYVNRVSRPQ